MVFAPMLLLVALARQATPTDTVQKFVAAWNAKDLATMAHLILGGKVENLAGLGTAPLPQLTAWDIKETITGTEATVTFTVTSAASPRERPRTETDKLRLVDRKWLVVPEKTYDGTQPGLLSFVSYGATTPGALSKTFQGANQSAKAALCLSHAKQLGLGVMMFMNDSDDKFMKKGADTHKLLSPYLKNEELWTCPVTGKPAFSVNARLYGTTSTAWASPATTVMVYEGKEYKLDFNHDGRASVCYCDGHAKLVSKDAAAKLRWKP